MTMNDTLSAALSKMKNAEDKGSTEVVIKQSSKIIQQVLTILQDNRFIGSFESIPGPAGEELKVHLIGRINDCGAIKPRFASKVDEVESYEERYLPAKDFGLIIMTTPRGVLTHLQAKENNTGGRLLAYCY